jgi:hypothetical protein
MSWTEVGLAAEAGITMLSVLARVGLLQNFQRFMKQLKKTTLEEIYFSSA